MADQAFSDFVYHGGYSFGIIPYNLQGWFLILLLCCFAIAFVYALYHISIEERLERKDNAGPPGKGKRK